MRKKKEKSKNVGRVSGEGGEGGQMRCLEMDTNMVDTGGVHCLTLGPFFCALRRVSVSRFALVPAQEDFLPKHYDQVE